MPNPVGYPDYARLQMQAGQILNVVSNQNINTNPHTPAMDMFGFGSLIVGVNDITLTAHFWVQVAFYTDQALTNQVATMGYANVPGGQMAKQFTVIAQWCQVTMIYLSGTTTDKPVMTCYGSNFPFEFMNVANVAEHILQNEQSVAASSSFTLNSGTIAPPICTLTFWHATNNIWHAIVSHYDRTLDAFVNILHVEGATAGLHFVTRMDMPPTQIKIQMFNDDTVARNCMAAMLGS